MTFRQKIAAEKRAAFKSEQYWGKPLPGFGDPAAELLIVGLAPAAHGGNRTGRVFTGDSSGSFLMSGLHRFGFANQPTSKSSNDGLQLHNAFILAAVRCVPPDNKPLPDEIKNCRRFFVAEVDLLKNVKAVLALGKIAMDGYLKTFPPTTAKNHIDQQLAFRHGAAYNLGNKRLFVSYHPSRQNTQTGRLTETMFDQVLGDVKEYLCY